MGIPIILSKKPPVWTDFGEKLWYGIPGAEWRGFKVADDTRGVDFDPTTGDRTPSKRGIESARQVLRKKIPRNEKCSTCWKQECVNMKIALMVIILLIVILMPIIYG